MPVVFGGLNVATRINNTIGLGTPAGNLLGNTEIGFAIDFKANNAVSRAADYRYNFSGIPSDFIKYSRASSGTYVNANGYIVTANANELRITYDPNEIGVVAGALLEPVRTNSRTYSEAPELWTNTGQFANCKLLMYDSPAPDGSMNARVLSSNTVANSVVLLRVDGTSQGGSAWLAYSFFYKKLEANFLHLRYVSHVFNNITRSIVIDLANNSVVSVQGGSTFRNVFIEKYRDDWYRVSLLARLDISTSNPVPFFIGESSNANPTRTNFGGSSGGGNILITRGADANLFAIWGFQIEAIGGTDAGNALYSTSYIKTDASAVTRSADAAFILTSEFPYNPDQGTILVKTRAIPLSGYFQTNPSFSGSLFTLTSTPFFTNSGVSTANGYYLTISNKSASNGHTLFYKEDENYSTVTSNSNFRWRYSNTSTGLVNVTVGVAYTNSNVIFTANGNIATSLNVTGQPYTHMIFGNRHLPFPTTFNAAEVFESIIYYPRAMANSELESRTI